MTAWAGDGLREELRAFIESEGRGRYQPRMAAGGRAGSRRPAAGHPPSTAKEEMAKTLPLDQAGEGKATLDKSNAIPAGEELIREGLLRAIGEPPGLLRVQVKNLWGDCYR